MFPNRSKRDPWVSQKYIPTSETVRQRAVSNSNSSKSVLAEHVCKTSHNTAWDDSTIITTNNRYGQQLCLDAKHIIGSPCGLHRDDGNYLQEYLHLVGR